MAAIARAQAYVALTSFDFWLFCSFRPPYLVYPHLPETQVFPCFPCPVGISYLSFYSICFPVWALKYYMFPCFFLHCTPSAKARFSFSNLKPPALEVSFIAPQVCVGGCAFSIPFGNTKKLWALSCSLSDFLLPLPDPSFCYFPS